MYSGFHIILTILIILITILGNGAVIFVFYKKHLVNGSNVFIIAFAVIDILSATLIAPQICFDFLVDHSGYNRYIRREIFIVIVNLTILSNVGLLSAVAIDRAWAVFRPFTYSSNKQRHIQTIAAILTLCVFQTTVQVFVKQLFPFIRFIFPIQILMGIFILFGSYPAIVYKLYRRSGQVVPKNELNQMQSRRLTIPNTSMHVSHVSESNIRMQSGADFSEDRINR